MPRLEGDVRVSFGVRIEEKCFLKRRPIDLTQSRGVALGVGGVGEASLNVHAEGRNTIRSD